jgi:hypothetical protein
VKPGSKNAIQLILSLAIIIFYNNWNIELKFESENDEK